MVFTHLPSNLLLMMLPFCPTFQMAAALFLLRELMVEMDVPTRQSYLYIGASIKAAYDLLMWWAFRRLKPTDLGG